MAFSKRHYEKLAKTIFQNSTLEGWVENVALIKALCELFRSDNRAFDEGKFKLACLGKMETK